MPYYLNETINGLKIAKSNGDGYSINIRWATAYPQISTNKIMYNIWMSKPYDHLDSAVAPVFEEQFFLTIPAYVSAGTQNNVDIVDLIPGQMYHFGVRAAEYDPTIFNPDVLVPAFNNLATYPQSLLAADISATATTIPLISAEEFPPYGTARIGGELIYYSSVDYVNNLLFVPGGTSGGSVIVDQGGGNYYTAGSSNVGQGTINGLTLVNTNAPTETWTIKCVEVLYNNLNQPIPMTARFVAIGSASGTEPGGHEYVWIADGVTVSNTILSFSITETSVFRPGDYFTVKVQSVPPGTSGRGYNGTIANPHNVDGYDGYNFYDPYVVYWPIFIEDGNTHVYQCWNRFDINHIPFTITDGYHQKTTDLLTTNLSVSDAENVGFPAYDYAGWHRTDPVMLLSGACVGSYIGGYMYCADGYSGVGMQVRGLNIEDYNNQRQEVLLSTTGEAVCLVQRQWTGITCSCMLPYNEYPENRCRYCYGTGFVVGWQQYFNPRRSDGKIMVRFDPVVDDLIAQDSGLESTMNPTCWTLTVPTLKDRDFLVRFDIAGNPEFRYEVLNVTRNKLMFGMEGVQKFALQRIRKTDPYYQFRTTYDTSLFPTQIMTTVGSAPGAFAPHVHTLVVNENITSVSQINQITGITLGHSHTIQNGYVMEEGLGHTHEIVLPDPSIYPTGFFSTPEEGSTP